MIEKTCLIEKFCFDEIELSVHIPFKFIAVFKRDETDQQSDLRMQRLTLPMPRLYFHQKPKNAKIFINHLNQVMLVFIG